MKNLSRKRESESLEIEFCRASWQLLSCLGPKWSCHRRLGGKKMFYASDLSINVGKHFSVRLFDNSSLSLFLSKHRAPCRLNLDRKRSHEKIHKIFQRTRVSRLSRDWRVIFLRFSCFPETTLSWSWMLTRRIVTSNPSTPEKLSDLDFSAFSQTTDFCQQHRQAKFPHHRDYWLYLLTQSRARAETISPCFEWIVKFFLAFLSVSSNQRLVDQVRPESWFFVCFSSDRAVHFAAIDSVMWIESRRKVSLN